MEYTSGNESNYTSSIAPRTNTGVVRSRSTGRASSVGNAQGGRVLKLVTEMGANATFGISPALTEAGVKSYLQSSEREKKEMQGLNERLGNYIGRVKGLEERNRNLVADLEDVRGKWGSETNEIKLRYGDDLTEARKNVDDESRRKAEIETKLARFTDELRDLRINNEDIHAAVDRDQDRIHNYITMLADAEGEAQMLRTRFKQLTDDKNRYTKENHDIADLLRKTRDDLDEESMARIDFQNQVQTLMEELEFLRRVHDQEVKELQALLNTQPADTKEFFKNELALAIRDIKDEYDAIAHQNKADMESWYKLKVTEVQNAQNRMKGDSTFHRDEMNRLRNSINDAREKLSDLEGRNAGLDGQVKDLTRQLEDDGRQYELAINERDAALRKMREECQMLVGELQTLLDTKQILDTEIAIYRKMLEGEESRAGLKQMVEQAVKSHSMQQNEEQEVLRQSRAEKSTRTTFQRSAKGNVAIADCDPDGQYISLENTHRTKEENVGEWKLRRRLDGNKKELVYTLPVNTVIKPGMTVKIWARTPDAHFDPPNELIFEGETSWGQATGSQTVLTGKDGEEKATFTQRTVAAK